MRQPWHRFLKYLLLTKHTDNEVRDLLRQGSGIEVGTAYLTKIRDELFGLGDKSLERYLKKKDAPTLIKLRRDDIPADCIERLDLEEAHNSTDDFKFAYECFSNYRKSHYLNVYLLCMDAQLEDVIGLYSKRFGEDILPDQILVYMKYFADFESMSPSDWSRFLQCLEPKQRIVYEMAPGRKLPYIQWRLGDSVRLSPDTVNQTLMTDFFMLAQDEYRFDARRDGWSDRATKFASLAMNASDRVRKGESPVQTTQKLIMLFSEQEEKIATHGEIDQGDDPADIPVEPGPSNQDDSQDN